MKEGRKRRPTSFLSFYFVGINSGQGYAMQMESALMMGSAEWWCCLAYSHYSAFWHAAILDFNNKEYSFAQWDGFLLLVIDG